MFKHVTAMFIVDDTYIILLVESNGMGLYLYRMDLDSHEYIKFWSTSDGHEFQDAIMMTVLFVLNNTEVCSIYESLYKDNEELSNTHRNAIFELSKHRINNTRIKLIIYSNSNMYPDIQNLKPEFESMNIELYLRHQ